MPDSIYSPRTFTINNFWDTSYSSDQVHHDGRCPFHNEFALVLGHYTCPEPLLSKGMFLHRDGSFTGTRRYR